MALPPQRNHRVSATDARTMLQSYRNTAAAGSERGGMFHGKAVQDLLAQPGCVGLRFYFGRKTDGRPAMVLVGVDAAGNDLSKGTILEEHLPCPPYCPDPDDLSG